MSDVYQHSVRASKFLRLKSSASLKKSNSFSMESQPSEKNYSMMEPSNINLLLPEEQKSTNIENPHHNDVLCGRGVTTNRHPGNESFRSLVGLNKEVYVSSTKRQKMAISRSIVEAVRSLDPPGRFLEKDPKTLLWSEVGHRKAVEKTSQALRDGAANLRKQLSADLGDPEFFNGVFDLETMSKGSPSKSGKKGKGIEKGKEIGKENKTRLTEKGKLQKKTTPAKRGHRRVNSNPSASAFTNTRYLRKEKLSNTPSSPVARLVDQNSRIPKSAFSTPRRPPTSQPRTPMTWNGVVSYGAHQRIAPNSMMNHQSPFDQRSPRSHYSYDRHPDQRRYSGTQQHGHPHSSSENYYEGHHRPWDSYGSTDQSHENTFHSTTTHPDSMPSLSPHAGRHSSSQSSSLSSPPSGPLPPGSHQFSPAGYRSRPHPHDWSPRRMSRHQKYPHSAPHRLHHPGSPSAQWKSGRYVLNVGYPNTNTTNDSSLSVPFLGEEESNPQRHRVLLAPRPRPLYFQTAPEPSNDLAPDFEPPQLSPREKRKHNESEETTKMETDEDVSSSQFRKSESPCPPGEEKKMEEKEETIPRTVVSAKEAEPPKSMLVETEERSKISSPRQDPIKPSASLSSGQFAHENSIKKEEEQEFENPPDVLAVEDIAMSPIPFEGEDPSTLMELPENILTLPISPCGPNDSPA